MDTEKHCVNCKAWKPVPNTGNGECHAHPPTPLMVMLQEVAGPPASLIAAPLGAQVKHHTPIVHAFFPVTNGKNWCRDWELKPVKVVNEAAIYDDERLETHDERLETR